jgi:hypothetical protein
LPLAHKTAMREMTDEMVSQTRPFPLEHVIWKLHVVGTPPRPRLNRLMQQKWVLPLAHQTAMREPSDETVRT